VAAHASVSMQPSRYCDSQIIVSQSLRVSVGFLSVPSTDNVESLWYTFTGTELQSWQFGQQQNLEPPASAKTQKAGSMKVTW